MAAAAASTGIAASLYPSLDGSDNTKVYFGATPGTNATWTKFTGNEAAIQTACVDAGWITVSDGATTARIPLFLPT